MRIYQTIRLSDLHALCMRLSSQFCSSHHCDGSIGSARSPCLTEQCVAKRRVAAAESLVAPEPEPGAGSADDWELLSAMVQVRAWGPCHGQPILTVPPATWHVASSYLFLPLPCEMWPVSPYVSPYIAL